MLVARLVKYAAQHRAQQIGVEHVGQKSMADAAQCFVAKAGVGQDAGRRVQLAVAIATVQDDQALAQVGTQIGLRAENVAERLQGAPGRLEVVGAVRPDFIHQLSEQLGRIGF